MAYCVLNNSKHFHWHTKSEYVEAPTYNRPFSHPCHVHCVSLWLEPTDIDQIYKVLKQAGEISGGANKNTGGGAAGGPGAVGGDNTFLQAVLKLKNGPKMGATGSSTLAGAVTAAMAQQSQQTSSTTTTTTAQQQQLPDINVINVPEYPERISRRGGGGGGPLKPGGLQQPQQNKGLSAPLADISSSGPKTKLSSSSHVSLLFLKCVCYEAFSCFPQEINYYTHTQTYTELC